MDAEKVIEKILAVCRQKNLKPTAACMESGAGKDLIANLRKGIIPSVEKVSRLAAYLGVTTSELLGEELPNGSGPRRQVNDEDIKAAFWGGMDNLSPAEIESLWAQVKKYKEFLTEEKIKEQNPNKH